MILLNNFESRLVRLVRALVGERSIEEGAEIAADARPRPPCISPEGIRLVRNSLATGVVLRLVRRGAWRPARFLRPVCSGPSPSQPAGIQTGRLWNRTPPEKLGLHFSPHSLDLLIWVVSASTHDSGRPWHPPDGEAPTLGDRLVASLLFDLLQATPAAATLCRSGWIRNDGLCRLLFPDPFLEAGQTGRVDFTPWLQPEAAWILETHQEALAASWVDRAAAMRQVDSAPRIRREAAVVQGTLAPFLEGAARAGRRDLARFLLIAGRKAIPSAPRVLDWSSGLDVSGMRLADRREIRETALAFPAVIAGLRSWTYWARGTGFVDEGYQEAQIWKHDWETLGGEATCSQAAALLREATSFAAT